MKSDKGYTGKVLVLDDESDNVEALLDFLDRCSVPYDFRETMEEGAAAIRAAHEAGSDYSFVICDNHFKEDVGGCPNFNGIDLVKVLMGFELDGEQKRFVGEHFGDAIYDALVDSYKNNVVMFSGSAQTEPGAEDIPLAQKFPDRDGICCEGEVIALMASRGFYFPESAVSIGEYKARNGLEDGLCSHAVALQEDGIQNGGMHDVGILVEDVTGYAAGCDSGYGTRFDAGSGEDVLHEAAVRDFLRGHISDAELKDLYKER